MTESIRKNNAQIKVMDDFRDKVNEKLKETGITCYYLAKQLGVKHATVRYFILDKREITPSLAVGISEILEMDTAKLMKDLLIAKFNDCTTLLETARKDELLVALTKMK